MLRRPSVTPCPSLQQQLENMPRPSCLVVAGLTLLIYTYRYISIVIPDTPCMPYMPTLTPQTTPMLAYMAYMECLGIYLSHFIPYLYPNAVYLSQDLWHPNHPGVGCPKTGASALLQVVPTLPRGLLKCGSMIRPFGGIQSYLLLRFGTTGPGTAWHRPWQCVLTIPGTISKRPVTTPLVFGHHHPLSPTMRTVETRPIVGGASSEVLE